MRLGKLSCALLSGVLLAALTSACAGPGSEAVARMESGQVEVRDEIEALKRAVEASYDRERAMAERLRLAEEQDAEMRQGVVQLQAQVTGISGRLDTVMSSPSPPAPTPEVFRPGAFDVMDAYRAAYASFHDRQYETALGQFARIVATAPASSRADNAQYWMGECYYGLGQYRQALTEFTKVFAYQGTEKDDDAQFKIARCYLALGETDKALAAFQKLLDEYPESEYLERSRKEIRYLRGP